MKKYAVIKIQTPEDDCYGPSVLHIGSYDSKRKAKKSAEDDASGLMNKDWRYEKLDDGRLGVTLIYSGLDRMFDHYVYFLVEYDTEFPYTQYYFVGDGYDEEEDEWDQVYLDVDWCYRVKTKEEVKWNPLNLNGSNEH